MRYCSHYVLLHQFIYSGDNQMQIKEQNINAVIQAIIENRVFSVLSFTNSGRIYRFCRIENKLLTY
jgi:hypothetical protein